MDTKSENDESQTSEVHQVDNSNNETEIQVKTFVEFSQQSSDSESVNENIITLMKERDDLLTKVKDLGELNAKLELEKSSIEVELDATTDAMEIISQGRDKARQEYNSLQQRNIELLEETINIKSIMLKKEEELKTLNTELSSKKQQLNESKNKEMQIRRIAKKYKDSFCTLKDEMEQRVADLAGTSLKEKDNSSFIPSKMEPNTGSVSLQAWQKKNILTENQKRISAVTEANNLIETGEIPCHQKLTVSDVLKRWGVLDIEMKKIFEEDDAKQKTITQLASENEKQKQIIQSIHGLLQCSAFSKTSTTPDESVNSYCVDNKVALLPTSLTAPILVKSLPLGSPSSSLSQDPKNTEDSCYSPKIKKRRLDVIHSDDSSSEPEPEPEPVSSSHSNPVITQASGSSSSSEELILTDIERDRLHYHCDDSV